MSTKHFINDPSDLVTSALKSLTYTNPGLALDLPNKIVYRRPGYSSPIQRVQIISGGGSGHEPSFAGMVGQGLLSAAVAGSIFASPSAKQIRTAIMDRVDCALESGGVLVTVMNYTGDVLNFGVAVEKARASGINVEMVIVGDDVGVGRLKGGKVGRRGIAGTVLVHKISGALASRGYPLMQVSKVARLVANNLVSVGASLEHVHIPGRKAVGSEALKEGEVEIGMGIHNEQGSSRAVVQLRDLISRMLKQMLDKTDEDRAFVNVNSNEVVLLLNNLGGVSVLEMGGILTEVVRQLAADYNIRPVRVLSGTYMTSLNGLGFSITLLNVVNTDIGGPSMIDLLDDTCEAVGWSAPISKLTWEARNQETRVQYTPNSLDNQLSGLRMESGAAQKALIRGLENVIAAEPEITRYDTIVGDGDCGIGMKRGAEAVLKHISANPLTGDVVVDVANIVPVIEKEMDGTSGALYTIFLNSLVGKLREASESQKDASPRFWGSALLMSCEALGKYTPAQIGDRTVMDALWPFVNTLEATGSVEEAAEAALKGAQATKGMKASLGRSVYIGGTGYEQVPDPGAWGLAMFFMGLARYKPALSKTTDKEGKVACGEAWELAIASRAAPAGACCTRNLFAMPLRAKVLLPQQQQLQQIQQQRSMSSAEILHRFRPRSGDEPEDVVFHSLYGLRSIELNRPKKLNALNGSMVRKMAPRLIEWSKSHMAKVIVLKGAGDKAFCAGGDVAQLAQWNKLGEAGQKKSKDYFAQEYQLDHLIATYNKPVIAFMDGITMGGGVGLSVHAPFRIATERTVFAMPETTIGFFPDVGASFFLPRLPGFVGTYLALTSSRLTGVNVFYSGIATHYLHSTSLPALESRLAELQFQDHHRQSTRLDVINATIEEYVTGLPHDQPIEIAGEVRKAIDRCFCHDSVDEILQALESEKSNPATGEWAKDTLKTLHKRSPTAVHVTLRQMRIGKKWSIGETFKREYAIAAKFMKHHDFTEGVTARLIEKREPNWQPESLEKISADESDQLTEGFFLMDESDKEFQLAAEYKYDDLRFASRYGVPKETDVEEQVRLGNKSLDQIVEHFVTATGQKQGVKQVVEEILQRKTKVEGGKISWVYE
ncbi:Dak1 domain-containing protein [Cladorrhinum sp. PSN259]|nr:Dak1 domain-containing protein [Cladorrhinum sp. PSN259]